ncbi:ABC transporter permease [Streptomyces avicenniae]|uniref:ABC transporter permease n=1 Tax=Streptomyces avicenniae TaxID=500153 RepID=UPI00069C842B|nr:ABC transporter permease subunit [Streptomyces avicenniae]
MTIPRQTADARIHDIGYRRYEGARLGARYARYSLFVHSLRGAFGLGRPARSKVLPWGLFAVMALPAVIMVAVASTTGTDELLIDHTRYALSMEPIVVLFLAMAAPQLVSLDLRYKTMPLYFSRPITRADYVTAKFAALVGALFLFTGLPLTISYVGGLLAELGFADQTTGYLQGLVATAVLSVLYAGIALLVASFTPRRGFGVAAVIAVLTIPGFAVYPLQALMETQDSEGAIGWFGLFSPASLVDGIQAAFLGGTTGFPAGVQPTTLQGIASLLAVAGLVALCLALLLRRYRKAGI